MTELTLHIGREKTDYSISLASIICYPQGKKSEIGALPHTLPKQTNKQTKKLNFRRFKNLNVKEVAHRY